MTLKETLRTLIEFVDGCEPKSSRIYDALVSAKGFFEVPKPLSKLEDKPDKNPVVEALAKTLHKAGSDWIWEEASWTERDIRRSHAREVLRAFKVIPLKDWKEPIK
jgi:hypothetical protein